ncbi:MAG TPA: class I SAM-dependent methyltransferase [Chloroflexota bacterium]|nr:class I SAM-dependent methyltransferase [Chloroflexota bacterium]
MNGKFWETYQPGFRFAHASVGTREFFDEVTAYRYALEPHIAEMVRFERWTGHRVLEAGCGIGTDGARFAGVGAAYTGMDASAPALALARQRFALDGLAGDFVLGSVATLPFADATFDLVFSHGVIHHVVDTDKAVREFCRVLKPGGTVLVMVYNRRSLNYYVTIMLLRRFLIGLVMLPWGTAVVSRVTGEPEAVIAGHRALRGKYGWRYVFDRSLFLSNNTDGPGNPLTKVYSPREMRKLFPRGFRVTTAVRYLNLRLYPGGARLAKTRVAKRLERWIGWHLYIEGKRSDAIEA